MKSLGEIFSQDDESKELYETDQQVRHKRAQMGYFTRSGNTFDFIHLVKNWENLVGPMLAQNTIPLRIKEGQLYILTKHAVFSQELGFMQQILIQKIEDLFPTFRSKIKKIRFINGNFSSEEFNDLQLKHIKQRPEKHTNQPHPFDPRFRARKSLAQQFFSDIQDEEMRELLVNLFLA